MSSFIVPEGCAVSEYFKTMNAGLTMIGTGLGCHCQGIANVRVEYSMTGIQSKYVTLNKWGTVDDFKGGIDVLAVQMSAAKDPVLVEIAMKSLYEEYKGSLLHLPFLLMSDNLDGVYTQPHYITRWFAEYLVREKGFAGISSHVAKNSNYQHPNNHHDQVWVLTPPTRFSMVVAGSGGFVGEIPKDTKTWIPDGVNVNSEYDGVRAKYAFQGMIRNKAA